MIWIIDDQKRMMRLDTEPNPHLPYLKIPIHEEMTAKDISSSTELSFTVNREKDVTLDCLNPAIPLYHVESLDMLYTHDICPKEIKLKKRTEKEAVAYAMGKYFTGDIELFMLMIHIQAVSEHKDKGFFK